jgi:hypothetical protein
VSDDEAILAVILACFQESPASYCGDIASALGEGISRCKFPYKAGWMSTRS